MAKNVLKYFLFLGIGGALLFLAFAEVDLKELWSVILEANVFWVLFGVLLGWFAVVSRGYRWAILLRPLGYKIKPWNGVHAVAVGYLTNLAIPRAGEVARCTSLHTAEKVPVDKLIGTVILERIFDLGMLILVMGLTLIFQFDNLLTFSNFSAGSSDDSAFSWVIPTVVIAIGVVLFFMRSKIVTLPFWGKVRQFISGIKEGVLSFKRLQNKTMFILHTLFIWLNYYLMIYVVFYAFEATKILGWSDALLLQIAGSLGIIIPVPAGGAGPYHFLMKTGLGILNIEDSVSLAFATIVHSTQLLMLIIGGAVGLIFLYFESRKSKANATHSNNPE